MGDVLSVRAWRDKPGSPFRYGLVDEYENDWVVSPIASRRPLTLRQLIELIDGAESDGKMEDEFPLVESLISYGTDPVDVSFAQLESTLYPDLGRYYASRLAAWGRAMWGEEEVTEDQALRGGGSRRWASHWPHCPPSGTMDIAAVLSGRAVGAVRCIASE